MVEDRSAARDVRVQRSAHPDRGRFASRNLDVDRLTKKVSGVIVSYDAEEGDYLIGYSTTVYRYVADPAREIAAEIVGYLPNLIYLTLIIVTVRYAVKALHFLLEAVGDCLLGLGLGYIAFLAIRTIDEHNLEVLITLALVMGGYALALRLHVSGPVAMAVAGLLIGNQGARLAMSENTRRHLESFWSLLDEVLNSVLFLLIGLEVLAIAMDPTHLSIGLAAIVMVVLGWIVGAVRRPQTQRG